MSYVLAFLAGSSLASAGFYSFFYQRMESKALRWHKERDAAVRDLEMLKMDKETFEARCDFLARKVQQAQEIKQCLQCQGQH
jgi:hypothetical protein